MYAYILFDILLSLSHLKHTVSTIVFKGPHVSY